MMKRFKCAGQECTSRGKSARINRYRSPQIMGTMSDVISGPQKAAICQWKKFATSIRLMKLLSICQSLPRLSLCSYFISSVEKYTCTLALTTYIIKAKDTLIVGNWGSVVCGFLMLFTAMGFVCWLLLTVKRPKQQCVYNQSHMCTTKCINNDLQTVTK